LRLLAVGLPAVLPRRQPVGLAVGLPAVLPRRQPVRRRLKGGWLGSGYPGQADAPLSLLLL
jgi:hypothetical protein